MAQELRVAVIGAGLMGADHIQRLHRRITGAELAVVVDVDLDRAQATIAGIPGAVALTSADEMFARGDVDAVLIATPGSLHEDILLQALERDLPILCEKPLTPDAASSWRVLEAERRLGHQRIQVGFMRRFDAEHVRLEQIVRERELGEALMLHCAHRNPQAPPGYTDDMLITHSVVHEFDAIRFLTGEEIVSVAVRKGRPTKNSPEGRRDPQQVLIETEGGILADVEIFMNARFGYQVATEAVFEDGVVTIGGDSGPYLRSAGRWGGPILPSYRERFGAAYDAEVQAWVDAAKRNEIGGPSAWDGYAAAACCEAGVEAQSSGETVAVRLNAKPDLYL